MFVFLPECEVLRNCAFASEVYRKVGVGMKSLLFGLGLGAALGVLFAPRSGEELRSIVSDRAKEMANSARQQLSGPVDSIAENAQHGQRTGTLG